MQRLNKKVALITGATSGIGADIARVFSAEGATVVVAGRNAERGATVASECGGDSYFLALDVAEKTHWIRGVQSILDRLGRLDVLVNNAAYMQPGDFESIDLADLDTTYAVNIRGLVIGCQQALAVMKRQATPASIINILSAAALRPKVFITQYAASKAMGLSLTQSLALHCAQQGYPIRCNAILPGGVRTPMLEAACGHNEEALAAVAASHPIGRMLEGREVAQAAVYLASDAASGITGIGLPVDGGYAID